MARLGSVCKVNGVDVYEAFGADLKSVVPVSGEVVANATRSLGRHGVTVISHNIGLCGMTYTFYVGAPDVGVNPEWCILGGSELRTRCYQLTSALVEACRECVIQTGDDEFEYDAVLSTYSVSDTGVAGYNEVVMTFLCVRRLPMVGEGFGTFAIAPATFTFTNVGTVASGMRITVVSTMQAYDEVSVCGVKIKNLPLNVPFVIDGIDGKVTQNGVNAFLQTDIVEFPKVQPGENTIVIGGTHMQVTIEYYPVFAV